jgi:hypothetical protein
VASPIDWLREAIAASMQAEADALRARATGGETATAERLAAQARGRLGTGEARERMQDAISARAIDDASQGALLEHLASIAEQEVLARRGISLVPLTVARVVHEGRERTLGELAAQARDDALARAVPAALATSEWLARDRAARLEALADATERRARIRSRGPAMPDDAPTDLRERCAAFLTATDDAAADLVERAHHSVAAGPSSLASRLAALAPTSLDGFVPARTRMRRLAAVLEAIGLERELRARVDRVSSLALAVSPSIVRMRVRATVLVPELEVGLASERAVLAAITTALVHTLGSPALPLEHAQPPRASTAGAMGALFGSMLTNERYLRRYVDASASGHARIRVAATAACVLEARHACAAFVAGPADARTDDDARERAARALVLDPSLVSPELARSSWITPTEAETRARTSLAALAWAPALRDRYDEDFFRNPRLADFVRGAAARGGTASCEAISAELGTDASRAAERVVELALNAGG